MRPKPKQPNINVDKMASKLHLGMTLDVVEQFFMTRTYTKLAIYITHTWCAFSGYIRKFLFVRVYK